MSDKAADYVLGFVILLCVAFWTLHIVYWRAIRRTSAWYEHRLKLRQACSLGESSLEWHAMRCTWCGNFHPEDDDECPSRKAMTNSTTPDSPKQDGVRDEVRGTKPRIRWVKGWPEMWCPKHKSWMGWLGQRYWLCRPCHTIWVGAWGVLGGPWR